jgi:Caspase domain
VNHAESRAATDFFNSLLKLWTKSGHRLLATLVVFDDGDWLAYSPEGFFDGTRRAWRLARVLFPDRPDLLYAPDQFFLEFYQPGLVADISKTGDDILSILKSRGDPRASLDVNLLKTTTPPSVELVKLSADGASVHLGLEAHGTGSGIKDCRIGRNGVIVWSDDAAAGGEGVIKKDAVLDLQPGDNALMAYCFNQYGTKSADAVLTAKGPSRPFTFRNGEPMLVPVGMAYVLAIGVGDYRGSFPRLAYAAADAKTVAKILKSTLASTGQFVAVKSTVLTDRQASRRAVLDALKVLSGRMAEDRKRYPNLAKLGPNDTLILYYAGHGETTHREFAMLPYQAARRRGLGDTITAQDLRDALAPEEAGHSLLILDTCTSGAALGGPLARAGPLDSRSLVQLAYEKGMYVLAAAQPDGIAKEVTEFKHGLLTYAFSVEGLQQRRAFNGREGGAITAEDAMIYAAERLGALQLGHMRWAADRGELAAYLPAERNKPVADRSVQRPRLFYPTDPDAVALVLGVGAPWAKASRPAAAGPLTAPVVAPPHRARSS